VAGAVSSPRSVRPGYPKAAPARCSKPPSGRAPPPSAGEARPTDTRPSSPPSLERGKAGDGTVDRGPFSSGRSYPVGPHLGAVSGQRHGRWQSRPECTRQPRNTQVALRRHVDAMVMAFAWVATSVTTSVATSASIS
jgi:hypothetical protein